MTQAHCQGCGGCTDGSGCGALCLSGNELQVLAHFALMPFYPAGYMLPGDPPVCLDFSGEGQTAALHTLIALGLVSSDPYEPVQGADLRGYEAFRLHGSVALTARGQSVIELLDVQGIGE